MNKKALGAIILIIGLIVLAFGIYGYAFSATATQTHTETIDASDGVFVQFELGQGDAVKGALTVLDGHEGIAVYVENPAKEVVYNGGTVYSSLEFSFNAQTSGAYIVNFDNLSSANQQIIEYSLTHSTNSRIVSLIATVIGALFLISGIIIAVTSIRKPAH